MFYNIFNVYTFVWNKCLYSSMIDSTFWSSDSSNIVMVKWKKSHVCDVCKLFKVWVKSLYTLDKVFSSSEPKVKSDQCKLSRVSNEQELLEFLVPLIFFCHQCNNLKGFCFVAFCKNVCLILHFFLFYVDNKNELVWNLNIAREEK